MIDKLYEIKMANLRQTILIRTDLGFSTGLLTAQVAHIHMERFRTLIRDEKGLSIDDKDWLKSPYTFVHEVKNVESLSHYIKKAQNNNIPVSIWKDTVYVKMSDTQMEAFDDVLVGVAFGPCDSDKIKTVIGDLPLLN